jgi:hypothetical protein
MLRLLNLKSFTTTPSQITPNLKAVGEKFHCFSDIEVVTGIRMCYGGE